MQRPGHRADRAGQRGRHIRAGGGDDAGGEGGGVHAVLGGRGPVGVDGLDVLGVGLPAPALHEALHDGLRLVDLLLRHHRQALPARRLGHVRQRHDRGPGEVVTGRRLVDVQQRFQAPYGREHGERRLHIDPDVAGVHRDRERLGGRQTGVERPVDQQPPDVPEGHLPDEILDVDPAVAERAALLIRFGDLRLERDDSLESGYEVGHQAAPQDGDGKRSVTGCRAVGSQVCGAFPVRLRGCAGQLAVRTGHAGDAPPGRGSRDGLARGGSDRGQAGAEWCVLQAGRTR